MAYSAPIHQLAICSRVRDAQQAVIHPPWLSPCCHFDNLVSRCVRSPSAKRNQLCALDFSARTRSWHASCLISPRLSRTASLVGHRLPKQPTQPQAAIPPSSSQSPAGLSLSLRPVFNLT